MFTISFIIEPKLLWNWSRGPSSISIFSWYHYFHKDKSGVFLRGCNVNKNIYMYVNSCILVDILLSSENFISYVSDSLIKSRDLTLSWHTRSNLRHLCLTVLLFLSVIKMRLQLFLSLHSWSHLAAWVGRVILEIQCTHAALKHNSGLESVLID